MFGRLFQKRPMRFRTLLVSWSHRFALGFEETTHRYFLSIPAMAGCEEYHFISKSRFDNLVRHPEQAEALAHQYYQR